MHPRNDIQSLGGAEHSAESDPDFPGLKRRLQIGLLHLGVEYRIEDGTVTLLGTVASYYEKQMAQEIVIRLGRFLRVENRCQVGIRNDIG